MLQPAQLYETELNEKFIEIWYNPDYMYYTFSSGFCKLDLAEDNYGSHTFASIDDNQNIIGFISYDIHPTTLSADNLAIMSFDRGNIIFGRDLKQSIFDIFNKYHMNRLEFQCIGESPHFSAYKRLCFRYGGDIVGHYHSCVRLMDGCLHDLYTFEIMADNFYTRSI